ncbi:MAG: hypothetical protein Q8P28_04515 [Deltaproteobacteria bacterium]|nr:hypothetical protein [Deltaproteobacteria bacterium]
MKRFLLLSAVSLVFAITAYIYPWSGLKIIPDAFATGGAFIYSKHGGGTTDGLTPCAGGVNRGLGADYGNSDPCNTLPGAGSYNTANPGGNPAEAGTYGSGECLHCHEPMASFGGGEPHPNASSDISGIGGPSPYLLFKGDYNSATPRANSELCWYCHENMEKINNSTSPLHMGRWSFYQGKDVFKLSTHFDPTLGDGTGSFYWPGTTETSATTPKLIWPRSTRLNLPTGNRGSCLNCHTPHGIKGTVAAPYDTNTTYTITPDGTGGVPAVNQIACTSLNPNIPAGCNPSVMVDYMIPRQLIAWEENLCEACHSTNGPSSKKIKEEINKRHIAPGSGHPIDDPALSGRHTVRESIPVTLSPQPPAEAGRPITEKHVECYDCHNPHAVKKGDNTPGTWDAGGRLKGMRYITINGIICDPVSSTNDPACTSAEKTTGALAQPYQPFIYELCFKCHGDSVITAVGNGTNQIVTGNCGGATPSCVCNSTCACAQGRMPCSNKKLEFQTTNNSFHPVAGPGRNRSWRLCKQLEAAFGLNCGASPPGDAVAQLGGLTINCTDCHNNNAFETIVGPITQSALRTTDRAAPALGTTVKGPHGSTYPSIRRAFFFNDVNGPTSFSASNFNLCFRCHNQSLLLNTGTAYTNFWDNIDGKDNLHELHLVNRIDKTRATCKNCHFNIHSNVQAPNAEYLIDGVLYDFDPGTAAPTPPVGFPLRLLNFSPDLRPVSGNAKPRWRYVTATRTRTCFLSCHIVSVGSCNKEMGVDVERDGYRPPDPASADVP